MRERVKTVRGLTVLEPSFFFLILMRRISRCRRERQRDLMRRAEVLGAEVGSSCMLTFGRPLRNGAELP